MRGQSAGRPDNLGRVGPETAAVFRRPRLIGFSEACETDKERKGA